MQPPFSKIVQLRSGQLLHCLCLIKETPSKLNTSLTRSRLRTNHEVVQSDFARKNNSATGHACLKAPTAYCVIV